MLLSHHDLSHHDGLKTRMVQKGKGDHRQRTTIGADQKFELQAAQPMYPWRPTMVKLQKVSLVSPLDPCACRRGPNPVMHPWKMPILHGYPIIVTRTRSEHTNRLKILIDPTNIWTCVDTVAVRQNYVQEDKHAFLRGSDICSTAIDLEHRCPLFEVEQS